MKIIRTSMHPVNFRTMLLDIECRYKKPVTVYYKVQPGGSIGHYNQLAKIDKFITYNNLMYYRENGEWLTIPLDSIHWVYMEEVTA